MPHARGVESESFASLDLTKSAISSAQGGHQIPRIVISIVNLFAGTSFSNHAPTCSSGRGNRRAGAVCMPCRVTACRCAALQLRDLCIYQTVRLYLPDCTGLYRDAGDAVSRPLTCVSPAVQSRCDWMRRSLHLRSHLCCLQLLTGIFSIES